MVSNPPYTVPSPAVCVKVGRHAAECMSLAGGVQGSECTAELGGGLSGLDRTRGGYTISQELQKCLISCYVCVYLMFCVGSWFACREGERDGV